ITWRGSGLSAPAIVAQAPEFGYRVGRSIGGWHRDCPDGSTSDTTFSFEPRATGCPKCRGYERLFLLVSLKRLHKINPRTPPNLRRCGASDQGSVFCERWCARRCRGETVRRWVLKFGLASNSSASSPKVTCFAGSKPAPSASTREFRRPAAARICRGRSRCRPEGCH